MSKIIPVKNKLYRNGEGSWRHGDPCYISGKDWRGEAIHIWKGNCPSCNRRTYSYGGGWACVNDYCPNNPENFACSTGPAPTWWETNISITKDGNMFCAFFEDTFINLQESIAGFGTTPQKAVDELLKEVAV